MKLSHHQLSLVLFCVLCPAANATLRTAAEMTRYADNAPTDAETFSITATVTRVDSFKCVYVEDATGATRLTKIPGIRLQPGDVVRASGVISFCEVGNASPLSNGTATVIGHVTLPPPLSVRLAELGPQRYEFRRIVTEGQIIDVFRDEIDDRFISLTLRDGMSKQQLVIPSTPDFSALKYLEARVRVVGMFFRRALGYRLYSGPYIESDTEPEILTPPPRDPFAAPELSYYPVLTPQEISDTPRRSAVGRVLGAWDGNQFLLRSNEGKAIRVRMLDGVASPGYGDYIRAVGSPATDLFHINLTRAIVRPEPSPAPFESEPGQSVDLATLMTDEARPTGEAIRFWNGRTIRFSGTVRKMPGVENSATLLHVQSGKITATVRTGTSGIDLTAFPEGYELDLTGLCLFECENWSPDQTRPRPKGLSLVLRIPGDLVVLRQPPWWTPRRLLMAIVILLAGLVGFILWNRNLNRLVNRRGQELAREKLRKETAQLKTRERTHLAVELHDSLSQTLEGIACQLATSRLLTRESDPTKPFLETAERMLDSCRLELRRCLFDLRGNALEQRDFTSALHATLDPICAGVELSVRFDVRRARFDDQTVHAVLCIVRELVANAIRHGKATGIRVAGECHDDALSFSVRDNGCGFDPENRPGASTGHFGLLGVQERVNRFDGTLSISSTPGRGTRVSARLPVKPIAHTANK